MADLSALSILERLPQRLRDSPYTVGVAEPMTELAAAYKEATLDLADQFYVPTATWGLVEWERLVGITPAANQTLEQRRSAVVAKLCSTGTTNAEMIRALAEALTGYGASVTENFSDYSFPCVFRGGRWFHLHRRRPAHEHGGGDQTGPPAVYRGENQVGRPGDRRHDLGGHGGAVPHLGGL